MNSDTFKEHFKKRLILISSMGLFVSCLCVATISIWPLYNQLKAQQSNKLLFAVKTKSMVVEEFLAKAKETARQITSRSQIRKFLQKYNQQEIELLHLRNFTAPKLEDALRRSEFVVGISRLDQQGLPVVQVGLSLPPRLLQPAPPDQGPVLAGPVRIGDDLFIVVSAPILERDGSQVGTDIILYTISTLREIIHDYIGLCKNGETILARMGADGRPEIFFSLRLSALPGQDPQGSRHLPMIHQALEKSVDLKSSQPIAFLDSPKGLAAYRSIKGIDWTLIVRTDKAVLFKSITRQVLVIIALIIVIVIPLGIIGLLLLLRPLSGQVWIHVRTLQQEIDAKETAIKNLDLAEKKLLDEKEQLRVTLRSIGDGVITTDLSGRIVLMNKITEQLTGWNHAESVGRPLGEVFKIINERTGQPCDNPVSKVLVSKKIIGLANHTALISRDGTQYSIEDSGAPIFNKEHQIIGTVLVFRDVTEEKRTNEELTKVRKLESVGILAGGIAHDFNNILGAILGNIELAEMSLTRSAEARPLLQEAKKASIRARDLTQQLLTFSKGGDPVKRSSSLAKVITDSANFVLHGSSVHCDYDIPDNLWNAEIDTGQISQVIQNIIINARDAMPDGGVIELSCQNITSHGAPHLPQLPKSYIKTTIRDSGCGITENYLDKIFDPYFSTKQMGSGLGLAICHSIIKKHDGSISVQSTLDEGTTFTLYLPRSHDTELPSCPDEQGIVRTVAKARIIIMDDEVMILKMTQQMLTILGHEVLLAQNGHEAIELYNAYYKDQKAIDLVIMDLTIPGGMGGQDTVVEILRIDPKAKVVVASGYSNDPILANCQEYGFKAAISKPFELSELNKLINSLLSHEHLPSNGPSGKDT